MTTITITITIDAGENARVVVNGQNGATQVPPFEDELVPLPAGAMALPGDTQTAPVSAFRGAATGVLNPDLCPVHRMPWKTVPGGISKKTGKPYDAFRACPERGCDQRPA